MILTARACMLQGVFIYCNLLQCAQDPDTPQLPMQLDLNHHNIGGSSQKTHIQQRQIPIFATQDLGDVCPVLPEVNTYRPMMRPLSRKVRVHWRRSTTRRAWYHDSSYSCVVKASGWLFSLAHRQGQSGTLKGLNQCRCNNHLH